MPTVISPVSPTPTGLANTSYLTSILLQIGYFFFCEKNHVSLLNVFFFTKKF
jgi:hypothetical protein